MDFDPAADRRHHQALLRDCRLVWRSRDRLDRMLGEGGLDFYRAMTIADAFENRRSGCRFAPEVSLALFEATVGRDPLHHSSYISELIGLLAAYGGPDAASRIAELHKLNWLTGRSYPGSGPVMQTLDDRLAFAARDDIWGYLEGSHYDGRFFSLLIEALLEPASPRHDFVRGWGMVETSLNVELVLRAVTILEQRGDAATYAVRAEAALWRIAPYSNEARTRLMRAIAPRFSLAQGAERDRLAGDLGRIATATGSEAEAAQRLLIPWLAVRLNGADSEASAAAARQLADYYIRFGDTALAPLAPWLEHKLRGSDSERYLAMTVITPLQWAGKPIAAELLEMYVRDRGGALDGGQLSLDSGNVRNMIPPGDYPSRAVREEREGLVSLSVLIAPDGRVLDATIESNTDGSLDLAEAARSAAHRRLRRMTVPNQGTHLVRATLPLIQFRLSDCGNGPQTPEVPGALVVTAPCLRNVIYELPVVLN
jgi:hypothetical protein